MTDVTARHTSVAVVGATPGRIAAAVRAAREGCSTVLVARHAHLGGMMASGLSFTDTTIDVARAPLHDEFFDRVAAHYREEYGPDSEQYERCNDGRFFEPKVAESIFDDLVDEADVDVLREYRPASVQRDGRTVDAVRVVPTAGTSGSDDESVVRIAADTFVDGTYEGDLAATAGADYRIGREPRSACDEQYAGRLFSEKGTRLFTGSTGAGDDTVQAYNYRLCLTRDPDNRVPIENPPDYDREEFLSIVEDPPESGTDPLESELLPCPLKSELVRLTRAELEERGFAGANLLRGPLPNKKRDLNTADLPGAVDDYPEGDPDTRRRIERRHREHVLGLLYFFQHDKAVPESVREEAREWGLPADEFTDNDYFPFQIYVREGRRLVGRATFTENDARVAEGLERAPINEDAVAIAEYPLDSHDCRPVRRPGSLAEGHFFVPEVTAPSQVPYGALLPRGIDNLLVPVALLATHVGFSTIRLEPTWLQIGEAAGHAAALAHDADRPVAAVDTDRLQRRLVDRGWLLSYVEEFDAASEVPEAPAVQYLATKGFFRDYEVQPDDPLTATVAREWADTARAVLAARHDPVTDLDGTERARGLLGPLDDSATEPVSGAAFRDLLTEALVETGVDADAVEDAIGAVEQGGGDGLSRGLACRVLYELLSP